MISGNDCTIKNKSPIQMRLATALCIGKFFVVAPDVIHLENRDKGKIT